MVTFGLLLVLANIYNIAGQCEQCLCPDTWIYYRSSCYKFVDNMQVDWTEAAHYCGTQDSDLVVIETADEDAFLQDFAKRLFKNASARAATDSFWIGATDLDVEASWTWYTDHTPLDYTGWNVVDGEPNHNVDPDYEQDCALMHAVYRYLWHDFKCSANAYPLCEISLCKGDTIIG